MADEKVEVTGDACVKFLEVNKEKEGVVTLASGLQYRTLRYGTGTVHPSVGTPCMCDYAGALIDGTEFSDTRSKGGPQEYTPGDPDLMEGWTEALQLMVEGDRWELFIPQNLAFKERGCKNETPGKPDIPPDAALVFWVEIRKIVDASSARPVVFPEWTEEEKKLLTEKDSAPVQKWREARIKTYEDGGLRDTHPTREGFDAWLGKQCETSRNKAIWRRTRMSKNAEIDDASKPPPQLSLEKGREVLKKALDIIKVPANKDRLTKIVEECESGDPAAGMMKMMKLMPAMQDMMSGLMKEYGYPPSDLLTVTMQIRSMGEQDAEMAVGVDKLMKAVQGDLTGLFA